MATFEELKECKLTLKVLNANTDAKTEMLGMYELDLTAIRKQPLGEYFMPWLALYTDPNEYVTELCGALRATITCLGGAQQVWQKLACAVPSAPPRRRHHPSARR
jgi:hypothetical protein